jgi:spore maturation protein CgeB
VKKILVVHPGPDFSVADVSDGLVKGLRAQPGVEVQVANLNDRLSFYCGAHVKNADDEFVPAFSRDDGIKLAAKGLEQICYEWWPDVIVVVSGFFIPPEVWAVLARRPHHVVLWCTESPYEDDMQAQPARYVNTVILNDPTNIEQLRTVNERTFYLPHSYDPTRHRPGRADPKLVCDFAFVGTGFPSRIEFFEKVDWTGIDAVFGGNWSEVSDDSPLVPFIQQRKTYCMDNGDAAALYRAAKVTANLYRKETTENGTAEGWAIGPREVELAACGSFFLREPRAEGDALFPMLPKFTTPTEFEDALRWWLAHPRDRKRAATQAREAIATRTFDRTAATLLRLVDGAPTPIR